MRSFKAAVDGELAKEAKKKKQMATREWIINYCADAEQHEFPLAETFKADDLAAYLNARKEESISTNYLQGLKSGIRHLFVIFRKRALYDTFGPDLTAFYGWCKEGTRPSTPGWRGKGPRRQGANAISIII